MSRIAAQTVGISASDRLLLGAFLDLVVLADGTQFYLSDDAHAAIWFSNPLSEKGLEVLAERNRSHLVVAFGTPHPDADAVLDLPIRLTALRVLLGVLSSRMQTPPRVSVISNLSVARNVAAHRSLESWITLAAQAETMANASELAGQPNLQILVFPAQKQISLLATEHLNWEDAVKANRTQLEVVPRPGAVPLANAASISLDQFRWKLALLCSHGILLPGLTRGTHFALEEWPDFGALGGGAEFMRLSALMVRRKISLTEMAGASRLPREQIVGFINACAVIGKLKDAPSDLLGSERGGFGSQIPLLDHTLAARRQGIAPVAPSPSSGFIGFLGKLRSALSLGGNR